MKSFRRIVIIYNPNSTGDSEANAKECEHNLTEIGVKAEIIVYPTKFKAHAEELVAEYSDDAQTLIISSSGDGGYNEVINGVLEHGGKAATTVLPSGNANDHYHATEHDDFYASLRQGKTRSIDALRIRGTIGGKQWERYAHSYVGLGLTPKVGKELTEKRPNVVTEKYHVVKHLIKFSHITIAEHGKRRRYGNLIFATIDRMSKVIKLDQSSAPDDGLMEIYKTEYVSLRAVLRLLLKASSTGLERTKKAQSYEFETVRKTLVQLDGEVYSLDGGTSVEVACIKDAITTI